MNVRMLEEYTKVGGTKWSSTREANSTESCGGGVEVRSMFSVKYPIEQKLQEKMSSGKETGFILTEKKGNTGMTKVMSDKKYRENHIIRVFRSCYERID